MQGLPIGPRGKVFTTLRYVQDACGLLRQCAKQYGDPYTLPLLIGSAVVTGDPVLLREIFTADPDLFDPPTDFLEVLQAPNSLLLLSGTRHKRERKLMMPPFHGARMRTYGQLIQDVALRCADRWRASQRLTMQPAMADVSAEVIIRAVFGVDDDSRVGLYQGEITSIGAAFSPLVVYLPFLRHRFGGFGPWSRYLTAVRKQVNMLHAEVQQRRKDHAERQDILSLLLAARDEAGQPMSDDELVDELRTLLMAGHETTAVSLSWALYEVHRQPAILKRLRDELQPLGQRPRPEELVALPYLSAVCSETLRLHPIAPALIRRLTRPFVLGGYTLPKGTLLQPAMAVTHFRPDLYPEPDTFRPDRFLERKFGPFELIGFGGGTRRCLGAAFAEYEMKVVLGSLLAEHRLAPAHDRPVKAEGRGLTLGPAGGVEMVYLGRTHA